MCHTVKPNTILSLWRESYTWLSYYYYICFFLKNYPQILGKRWALHDKMGEWLKLHLNIKLIVFILVALLETTYSKEESYDVTLLKNNVP